MKIIIDAMGGDNAPLEIVKGALLGMEHWGVEVLLTGRSLPKKLEEAADYITRMESVRHPYDRGVSARRGIEY